ncbi:class I SAM-dependent methyltransferase [Frankia gtarii]|uniref:class I SAM-dependent methyltransferase n=1 Tax=Frankia gtarii TaxID=2950102 RepID=UPI0021C24F0F|nr:class I SAM-dependent methyltransferase [Frankia gtarii]
MPLLVTGTGYRGVVFDEAEVGPGARVLDLGGDALLTAELLKQVDDRAVVLVRAGENDAPAVDRLRPVRATLEALPLPDGDVGLVVGNDVFRNKMSLTLVLQEIARVVRPGGWVSLVQPADDRVIVPAVRGLCEQDGGIAPRRTPVAGVWEAELIWRARAVGLLPVVIGLGFTSERVQAGDVEAYLHRRVAGMPSLVETVTAAGGADAAAWYVRAWRHAAVTAGSVDVLTPVVQLDAVRVDPWPDRPVTIEQEWYEAYSRTLDQARAVGIPRAAWQIGQAVGRHLDREDDLRRGRPETRCAMQPGCWDDDEADVDDTDLLDDLKKYFLFQAVWIGFLVAVDIAVKAL